MAPWSIAPVIDWLLHKGRRLPTREHVVREICERVRAAGMPIERVAFFFYALHPQYFGVALYWDGEKVTTRPGNHDVLLTGEYRDSPAARISAGERAIRRRLEGPGAQLDFPFLRELKAAGLTDYVIAEVVSSDGTRNSVSLATRRPGGFTDRDIAEIEQLLHPFALVMEIHSGRELARTLLETYLGRISGSRVLDGQIKRGDGQSIDAVIWFSDLRDSTPLSAALGEQRFLELLNEYFAATAGAVLEHGGEVLRFIGDASLAVFPTAGEPARAACERAVAA
ncbi:MAG: adenylate/guanylate cyclase domain-containing protein, partial [Burkholderiales bacterium]